MKLLMKLLLNALAFYIVAYLLPGVDIVGYQPLFISSIVWGILTLFIKPLLVFFTLPLNFLTLGLFTFVINAVLLLLTANIVAGFTITGFGSALLAAILLAVVNAFLNALSKD